MRDFRICRRSRLLARTLDAATTWERRLVAGGAVCAVAVAAATNGVAAQVRVRRSPGRTVVSCGGDQSDGLCPTVGGGRGCSDVPGDANFDVDCLGFQDLISPLPAPACDDKTAPCEIHEAINRMGGMTATGRYDDRTFLEVVLAYWDGRYWDLDDSWGAHGLDGYVVYAITRTAMRFHADLAAYPTTARLFERLLRDHADRGLPTTVDNGERWFHGGESDWNTWSEDYIGFALGYAAADAWFASPWPASEYFDEYRGRAEAAVELAFSISHSSPHTLRWETDRDPAMAPDEPYVMLRNHNEYSPVYAMAIIARLWDVNTVYREAGLPDIYTPANKPDNLDALYKWMRLKVEPNPTGGGYVFRSDGCERRDGVVSFCDDRPGNPGNSPGHQREPGHYPLDRIMPEFGITEGVEAFGPGCDEVGPAGTRQKLHNYYFNCVFFETESGSAPDSTLP